MALAIFLVGGMVTDHPTYLAAITSFISYLMQILFSIVIGGFMMTFASRAFVSLGRIDEVFNTKPQLTFPDVPETTLVAAFISITSVLPIPVKRTQP